MKIIISTAKINDLEDVFKLRHEVYASELKQYNENKEKILYDVEGINSTYIIAKKNNELIGFIGITPPKSMHYSVDRYINRDELPGIINEQLYEIRALTIKKQSRGSIISSALMYAAFRWIESNKGKNVISMGIEQFLDMYYDLGFKNIGKTVNCGSVNYEIIIADLLDIKKKIKKSKSSIVRIKKYLDWNLDISFESPSECYHGGAFFDAIGNQFDTLNNRKNIISADVLDAWFSPPKIIKNTLINHLDWIMRTSPPTRSEGFIEVIAKKRNLNKNSILPGAGSSDLIFLAFNTWLDSSSKVLILNPTYGEYIHILKEIIGCKVERFLLKREEGYQINLERLQEKLSENFDLFIWVNPNSPTGLFNKKKEIIKIIERSSQSTRFWIDETYIEYAGTENSMESYAMNSENIIVCKSLSKVYALSGLRAAYLCSSPHNLEKLVLLTPPWSISLPAQIAATYALQSKDYYDIKYKETHFLRGKLIEELKNIGIKEIIPGIANFIMFHLPDKKSTSDDIIEKCKKEGLFLRNVKGMGSNMGDYVIRIAVKDEKTNQKMIKILKNTI